MLALSEISTENQRNLPSNCSQHGDYVSKVADILGREIKTGCPVCLVEAEAKRKAIDEADNTAIVMASRTRAMDAAGITPRFSGKSFENFRAESKNKKEALTACREIVQSIVERKATCPSLILCGMPGTGKSHLAAAMAIALIDAGKSVRKINASDMIRLVRDTWSRESRQTESDVYTRLAEKALLIIDEVGVQNGSDNEKIIMFEVMNRRYEACLPTVLISNLGPNEIRAELGDRVTDRLKEDGGKFIPFDWNSARGPA